MQIQARLLVLISLCLQEIQRASKLSVDATNIDNLLLGQFDHIVHSQLAVRWRALPDCAWRTWVTCTSAQPVWYALGEKTRFLISDVRLVAALTLTAAIDRRVRVPSLLACMSTLCHCSRCCRRRRRRRVVAVASSPSRRRRRRRRVDVPL